MWAPQLIGIGGGVSPIVPIAHVAISSPTGNGGYTSAARDTTGAASLVMAVSYQDGSTITPSDSKGNTWVPLGGYGAAGARQQQLFICLSPTVGSGHTFSMGGSASQFSSFAVAAFSQTGTLADGNTGASNAATNTIQPGSITPPLANALLITGIAHQDAGAGTLSIDSGFTILEQLAFVGGTSYGVGLAYKVQTAAAAENPTWTAAATNLAAAMTSIRHS